ncbi:TerB N-terminal domain-containing protein [Xenorhabdus sp. DI]|uniref:tellurite resistance TerB family protein n=1 Tax=Xenorhabdus doucetiae TaxID=351671 RepID=UPI00198504A8|nr:MULTISPECIES: TerB N-terminal domain-containing protein [unclassified Xenorhabdus]MBD2784140.1 TerB N-terminal domain-containing protein [Xenorhabdus sp. 3]MBD2789483.1 TerB N-terminal domain-containing protein [Xenorhabdus sp. DI]
MDSWIFFVVLIFIYLLFFKKKKNSTASQYSRNNTSKNTISQSSHPVKSVKNVNTSSSQIKASDDEALATFTLVNGLAVEFRSSHRQVTNSSTEHNRTPARWVIPGENVKVQNIVINRGNFYLGGQIKSDASEKYTDFYSDGSDASLVNDALSIQTVTRHHEDDSLGYWPSYSTLSPSCRGAYLDWLASDRNDVTCPIGYVFIYFYGLERRILVDGKQKDFPDTEFKMLFEEVSRLRHIFQTNNSFRRYATQLMEAMLLLRPNTIVIDNENEYFASGSSLLFQFRLATIVAQKKPIPAELALAWVKYYTEYALRTPARRCAEEFTALFKQRYVKKFGEGLVVKPNKTRLKLEYTPASSSLRRSLIELPDLPDPSILRAPVQKLIQVAESCINELDAYSRYLGKKDTSRNDVAAIMLLPNEILTESAEQMFTEFKNWAEGKIQESAGLATVADFWSRLGMPLPEKINKKEAELMQNFAQRAGYGIAPDMRYHHFKPEPDGEVVLFADGHGEFFSPSTEFIFVSVALRLGAMVAQTDKYVDTSEQVSLEKVIDSNNVLSPTEKRSLHAYLNWQLNTPASMVGLKGKMEQLSDKEKSAIGNVVISVAYADGKIDPAEIKQLEKIYTSLGLDSSTVTSDIHRLSTVEKTSPSAIFVADGADNEFSLNENILARHESDTKDVRQLLSSIFVEDESEEVLPTVSPAQSTSGLDEAHSQLYQHLLEKELWTRNEVTELCQQLNLMVSGAIEAINDWSYEQVDAPVLDDDDDIYVDLEIAQELKG